MTLRVLTRAKKVVETRDVTWEATFDVEASPSRPLELPEQGGAEELEDASDQGGTDDFDSAPTTPLTVSGRGIPHQLRAVSPKTQADDGFQAGDAGPNDVSTVSSESSDSDFSSRDGSDTSTSYDAAPTPTPQDCCAPAWSAHVRTRRR